MRRAPSMGQQKFSGIMKNVKSSKQNPQSVGSQLETMNEQRRMACNIAAALGVLALIVQIVIVEVKHANNEVDSDFTSVLKGFNTAVSLIAIGFLAHYYRVDFGMNKKTLTILEGDTFFTSGENFSQIYSPNSIIT
jgi:pheromone shutdown protein TraB